jgi:hypothetical protein
MGQKDVWIKAGISYHTSVKDAQWNKQKIPQMFR